MTQGTYAVTTLPKTSYVSVDFQNRTNCSLVVDSKKLSMNKNQTYELKLELQLPNGHMGSLYNLILNVKWLEYPTTQSNSSFVGVVIAKE